MDEMEVRQIVAYLRSAGYPQDVWTPERIDVWCQELVDLDFETAATVSREWVKSQTDAPTIADIRRGTTSRRRQMTQPPTVLDPPVSDEQRIANLARIRQMTAKLSESTAVPGEENAHANPPPSS